MGSERTITGTFAAKALGFLLALVTGVILSRSLGPADRGILDVSVMFAIMVLAFLPPFEDPQLYRIGRKTHPPGAFLCNILILTVCLGALGIAVLGILRSFAPSLFAYTDPKTGAIYAVDPAHVRLAAFSVPAMLLFRLIAALLQGHRQMKAFNLLYLFQQSIFLLLVIALVVISGLGIEGGLFAHLISFATAAVLAVAVVFVSGLAGMKDLRPEPRLLLTLAGDACKLYLGVVAAYVILYGDKYILNRYWGPEYFSWYALAVTLSGYLRRFTQEPVKDLLGSRLPSLADDRLGLASTIARASRNMVFLLGILSLPVLVIGYPVIAFVYGKDFTPAYIPLVFLLPGSVAWSVAVLLSYYFIGQSRFIFVTVVGALLAILNIALNVLLVPRYHMVATAMTSLAGYTVHLAILYVPVRRETGILLRRFFVIDAADLMYYSHAARSGWKRVARIFGRRRPS